MKKFIVLALVIVTSLCLAFGLTACDVHKHVLGDLIPEVPAICVDGVKAHYKCEGCGALFDENKKEVKAEDLVIPAVHDFGEWDQVYEATETTSGLKTRSCRLCGKIETQYTDLLDHDWSVWEDNGNGTHSRSCSHSDCPIGSQTESCLYGQGAVNAPTCLDGGYTTYECTVCGYTMQQEEVDALGHDYGEFSADYIGLENLESHVHTHSRTCRRCGDVDVENCVFTQTEVIAPTCELGGYTKHTCSTCGSIHEDTLTEATGHTWSKWSYDESSENTHKRTCSNNPLHIETESCVYTEAVTQPTCNSAGFTTHTCSTCQHSYQDSDTEPLAHVFGDWEYVGQDGVNEHQHKCLLCQQVFKEACQIVTVEEAATCLQGGSNSQVCKVCLTCVSETELKPLGHKWGAWTDNGDGTHTRVCENDNSHKEANINHNYTVETTPADCTNARLDSYTCVDCNSKKTESVGNALGHSWGAWVITATDHTRTCQLNGNHVEKASHNFTTTNLCNSCQFDGLGYTLKGSSYVVTSARNLPSSVTTLIINALYTAVDDNTPRPVTEIARTAFYNNSHITTVVLPETLTLINYDAFFGCTSLTSVTVNGDESALIIIDSNAFYGCTSLVTFEIPDSVTTIATNAFYNCTSLRDIIMPDSVTSVGSNAFFNTAYYNADRNWTNGVLYLNKHLLKAKVTVADEYVINEGTLTIGYQAFSDCVNLTKITLPISLSYVERDAFLGCFALYEVEYSGDMDDWFAITFVNDASSPLYYAARLHIEGAVGDLVIPDHVKAIPAGTFRGTQITGVVIPEGVTSIGEEAFENCESLVSITIPDSVTYIGKNAFTGSAYYNDKDKWTDGVLYINHHLIAADADLVSGEYKVANGTLTIGIEAFKDCVNLTKVTIADSVVRIGAGVFNGCTALTGVELKADSKWFINRVQSISRLITITDLTNKQVAELFTYYDGEWKLWS